MKACLQKYVCNTDYKEVIKDAISARVVSYSKRIRMASLGLTHIIKQAFEGVQDVREADLPFDPTNVTFFRQLMLGTDGAFQRIPIVQQLHSEHPEYLVSEPRHAGDRNIYSSGSIKYMTNLKNHLRCNILRFIKRRMYRDPTLSNPVAKATVAAICGYAHEPQIPQGESVPDDMVVLHRSILGLSPGDSITPEWLDDDGHLQNILRYFEHLNREIRTLQYLYAEQFPERRRAQAFDIVPICSCKAHFVTIDTSVLHGILKEIGMIDCNGKTFASLGDEHWRSVFQISRLEGKSSTFTGTMDTDGVSICVHQRRLTNSMDDFTNQLSLPHFGFELREGDVVVGGDPGGTDLIHFAVPTSRGDKPFASLKLSKLQYYRESGVKVAQRRSVHWNSGIKSALETMSGVSSKGSGLQAFVTYMTTYLSVQDTLWQEYLKTRWARQRLRLYGGKKRTFARFFNKLEAMKPSGGRIVVAYGASKFAPSGPGRMAGPTTRVFKECKNRFLTALVDEFRSTKVNAETGAPMKTVEKRIEGGVRSVRGLLWCDSTNQQGGKFVNRDLNAAINIHRCFAQPQRPSELCRIPGQPRLDLVVGRRIKR